MFASCYRFPFWVCFFNVKVLCLSALNLKTFAKLIVHAFTPFLTINISKLIVDYPSCQQALEQILMNSH